MRRRPLHRPDRQNGGQGQGVDQGAWPPGSGYSSIFPSRFGGVPIPVGIRIGISEGNHPLSPLSRWVALISLNRRRLRESNPGSRFCRPLPYHLAKSPRPSSLYLPQHGSPPISDRRAYTPAMPARRFPGLPHGSYGLKNCGTAVVLLLTVAACGGGVTRARPSLSAPSTAAPAPPPSPLASPLVTASWPVYHQNPERTGVSDTTPAPASLTVGWRARLDGAVYGQPLDVAGEILVATENDTVYALSPATGAILWSTHLGTPVEGGLPCGDILPLGITGTLAYDPLTETVFAVAEEAGFRHLLYALDPLSGAVRWSRRVDIQIPSDLDR